MYVSCSLKTHEDTAGNKRDHWTITDTDFVDTVDTPWFQLRGVGVGTAVIECYERRQLPVVPNLMIALQQQQREMPTYYKDLSAVLAANKQGNPRIKRYEDEINKYLLLI